MFYSIPRNLELNFTNRLINIFKKLNLIFQLSKKIPKKYFPPFLHWAYMRTWGHHTAGGSLLRGELWRVQRQWGHHSAGAGLLRTWNPLRVCLQGRREEIIHIKVFQMTFVYVLAMHNFKLAKFDKNIVRSRFDNPTDQKTCD